MLSRPTRPRDLDDVLAEIERCLSHGPSDPAETPDSPRELRARLAARLAEAGRLDRADTEYQLASEEGGTTPSPEELSAARGRLALRAGRKADALQLALAAVSRAPRNAGSLLPELAAHIDPAFVERHGTWAVRTLHDIVADEAVETSTRADAAVAEGACGLLLGNVADSLPAFRRAAQLRPDSVGWLFGTDGSSPSAFVNGAVEQLGKGGASWALAQVAAEVERVEDALPLLDAALDEGVPGDDWPEAEAYELRARLRIDASVPGAENDLFAAGCRFGWRGEYHTAVKLLAEAEQRGLRRPDLYWYWADDLRLSAMKDPARTDLLGLDEAEEVWSRGRTLGDIEAEDAWAYLVRSAIATARAGADEHAAPTEVGRSLADIEAAIALLPSSIPAWAEMAEQWSNLGYWHVRAHAQRRLEELTEDDDVSEAVSACRVTYSLWQDTPDFPGVVDEFRQRHGSNVWLDLMEGIGWLDRNRHRAVELLRSAHASDPDPSIHYFFARALLLTGRWTEAAQEWDALWDRIGPGGPADQFSNWSYRVLTACVRSDWDEAAHWAARWATYEERTQDVSGYGAWLRLLPAIGTGDSAAVTQHLEASRSPDNPPRWLSNRLFDLECLEAVLTGKLAGAAREQTASGTANGGSVTAVVQEGMSWAAERLPENVRAIPGMVTRLARSTRRYLPLEQVRATARVVNARLSGAEDAPLALLARCRLDLTRARSRYSPPDGSFSAALDQVTTALGRPDMGPQQRLACRARACDLLLEAGRWHDSALEVLAIEREAPDFPVSPRLRIAAESLRDEIADRAAASDFSAVRELSDSLAEIAAQRPDLSDFCPEAEAARALAVMLSADAAAVDVQGPLSAVAASGLPDPPRALGELWSRLLPDATSYWRLVDALAADSADPATGAVREGLLGFLTHRFCGDADGTATPLAPVATPVVVCLGEGLVPDDAATTWRSWRLFTSDIPELRARISEQIGVTLPGFNVRGAGDTLPLDGYTLSLDGAFRRRGRVRADGWFLRDCDAADLPPDAVLDRASDPRTGRPGAWVSPDDGRAVRGRGGEVWDDPIEYVVADLESLLRENLDLFLRIDDVERLLDRSVDPAVMAAALPTPEDRRRFAWALRHAVRRRHLIGDLPAVLQAYAGAGPATEARLEAVLAVTPAVEGLS